MGLVKQIADMEIHELAGISFPCACGITHEVGIKKIAIGELDQRAVADYATRQGAKRIYLIADIYTNAVAGDWVKNQLEDFRVHMRIFDSKTPLAPDEFALGAMLADIEMDDDLIIAVGSGVLNDLARMLSAKTKIPYVIVATAPSMDGYASTVSPLILGGEKITKSAVFPDAIFADVKVFSNAPQEMLTAGFGDIVGKRTANADWRLAVLHQDERYCETCAHMVNTAVERCIAMASGYKKREKDAVNAVASALVLSGVAMGMFGDSRPASGAEHHLAHFWEVDALRRRRPHVLHGNAVAVASLIVSDIYQHAKPYFPSDFTLPDRDEIESALKAVGAPIHPNQIGISHELLHRSIREAMFIRDRYTALRFCDQKGILNQIADKVTASYF